MAKGLPKRAILLLSSFLALSQACDIIIKNDWGNGYIADIIFDSPVDVTSWTLELDFDRTFTNIQV